MSWIWCPFAVCFRQQEDGCYDGPTEPIGQPQHYTSSEGTQQLMTRHIRCYSSQRSADSISENGNAANN